MKIKIECRIRNAKLYITSSLYHDINCFFYRNNIPTELRFPLRL